MSQGLSKILTKFYLFACKQNSFPRISLIFFYIMRTRVFDLHNKKNKVYHHATFFHNEVKTIREWDKFHVLLMHLISSRWKKFDHHYTVNQY